MEYKACLELTGAIQDTSHERLYKELGLESFSGRRWVRKLTFFYKIIKGNSPQYLSNYLKGNNNSVYNIRSASQISLNTFRTKTEKFIFQVRKLQSWTEPFDRYSCIIHIIEEYLQNVDFFYLWVSSDNNFRILRILSSLECLAKAASDISM